jgi:hypothetical protein
MAGRQHAQPPAQVITPDRAALVGCAALIGHRCISWRGAERDASRG